MKHTDERTQARDDIIAAANRFALRSVRRPPKVVFDQFQRTGETVPALPFGARHVQRAANICRRFGLVKPETLEAAGFKAPRSLR